MSEAVIIALGANLGAREASLAHAVALIQPLMDSACKVSSWYRSAPQDMQDDSGEFLNGVLSAQTSLTPEALLAELQSIESSLGRPLDHDRYVARPIDLDIICYGPLIFSSEKLVIPHPRARERVFVLEPLAEILPGFVFPGDSVTVEAYLDQLRLGD